MKIKSETFGFIMDAIVDKIATKINDIEETHNKKLAEITEHQLNLQVTVAQLMREYKDVMESFKKEEKYQKGRFSPAI